MRRQIVSVSDRSLDQLLRLGVLALVVCLLSFGVIYFRDQHVDRGLSLVARQVAAAELAVRKEPGSFAARLQLAAAYRADNRLDDALKQYDEILKVDANHKTALLGRGAILLAKGRLDAAAADFRKITAATRTGEFAGADTQLEEAHYYLGSIAMSRGATTEAIAELRTALAIEPTDADAWYLLGVSRLKTGDARAAVDALRQALLFVPTGWCEPYTQLGGAYAKLGDVPRAEYAGAMLDLCMKRPAEAKRRLEALTGGPVAVEAMLGLGLVAETASGRTEAIGWYQKVLAVDATNISAMSALSRLGVGPPAAATSSPSPTGTHPATAPGS